MRARRVSVAIRGNEGEGRLTKKMTRYWYRARWPRLLEGTRRGVVSSPAAVATLGRVVVDGRGLFLRTLASGDGAGA